MREKRKLLVIKLNQVKAGEDIFTMNQQNLFLLMVGLDHWVDHLMESFTQVSLEGLIQGHTLMMRVNQFQI